MIIWVIGLAGSGKTTLANIIHAEFVKEKLPIVLLDGDYVRQLFGNDLGYTKIERLQNAQRIMSLCKLLDKNKINAICAILSISEKNRQWCRKNFSNYLEIYLKCDINIIQKRKNRDIYSDYDKGLIRNVVGKDIIFEEPRSSDHIINNDKSEKDFILEINKVMDSIFKRSQ